MGETKNLGEVFTVERDCAPSTGYRWYLTRLDQGLSLVDFRFRYDGEVRPGSGGKDFFSFQAVKEGSAGVHLTKYRLFDLSTVDAGEELTYTLAENRELFPLTRSMSWAAGQPLRRWMATAQACYKRRCTVV